RGGAGRGRALHARLGDRPGARGRRRRVAGQPHRPDGFAPVSMGVDGIVFDFDGLVLDTEAPIYAAWCAAFESFGCPPPTIEQWSVWIGTDTDDSALIDALLAGARRPVDLDAMHEARRAHRDELLTAEAVRPGVIAWIDEAAAAGIGLAIASSSSDDWVLGHLERLGVRERFDH